VTQYPKKQTKVCPNSSIGLIPGQGEISVTMVDIASFVLLCSVTCGSLVIQESWLDHQSINRNLLKYVFEPNKLLMCLFLAESRKVDYSIHYRDESEKGIWITYFV
jgi:hypothetical protein